MGNKPFAISLKLDQTQYQAGDLLQGRLYLSVDSAERLRGVCGVNLSLQGNEHVQICDRRKRQGDVQSNPRRLHNHGHGTECRVDRSTHSLVRIDYPIVKNSDIKVGRYEYPFQWRLPSDLPSSMYCQKNDDNSTFAQITYTLTAYFNTGGQNSLPSSENAVCILSHPSNVELQPVFMEMEHYPIQTCCIWDKGTISFGWQVDSEVASLEGQSVAVHVVGENRSSVPVNGLKVKWLETVSWSTGPNQRRSVRRTVAEESISTHGIAWWQPYYNPNSGNDISNPPDPLLNGASASQRSLTADLKLARNTRETFEGRHLQVRHTAVVTVITGGFANTCPESACQVRVVRKFARLPRSSTTSSTPPSSPGRSGVSSSPPHGQQEFVPEAQLVSDAWGAGPIVGEAIEIPEAQVVVLDEELGGGSAIPTGTATAVGSTSPASAPSSPSRSTFEESRLRASAPDESEVLHQAPALEGNSQMDAYHQPDVQQLVVLVQDSPDNLWAVLDDAAWTTLVQNLGPRDFCSIVKAAGGKSPSVAETLGHRMGSRLQCRHVLACLWSLPDTSRLEVLRRTAPLASDIEENRLQIEQELSPMELAHLRAALEDC